MGEPRPPFDTTRAAFWLIAFVIFVHAAIVAAGVAMCVVYSPEIIAGRFTCDSHDKLRDLLTEAMAAALAFSGLSRR